MEDPVEWERDLKGVKPGLPVKSSTLTSLLGEAPADDGPRPPSEFDEDEADELAALAEDEAYWEALGNTDDLDDLDTLASVLPGARPTDDEMDMS